MKKSIKLDIPFYSQNNSLSGNKDWERKICGLACIRMCIEFFNGESPNFEELLSFRNKKYTFLNLNSGEEKEYKYYLKGTGWLHYGLLAIAKQNGLFGICDKINKEDTINYFLKKLEKNICIIASVNLDFKNQESKGGHLVVIKGIEYQTNTTYFTINDPIQNNGDLKIEIGRFINNFSGNIILVSNENQEKFSSNSPILINSYPLKSDKNNLKNVYFHIHENEQTALSETMKYIKKNKKGNIYFLKQNGERFIRFALSGEQGEKIFLRIDPNRIFNYSELEKTIVNRNSHLETKYIEKAKIAGKNIRNYILNKLQLNKNTNYICVHTNKFLNINSFLGECELININLGFPTNAFIIVPSKKYFQLIKKLGINVIYYNNENDGSLRDYLQSNGYKGFTIETGENDKKTYKYLLDKLNSILDQSN